MELIATPPPSYESRYGFTLSLAVYTSPHRPGMLRLAYSIRDRAGEYTTFHNVPDDPFASTYDDPEIWRQMEADYQRLMPGSRP